MDLRCIYRFCQEGLPVALEHISQRILYVSIDDMIRLLEDRSLTLPQEDNSKQDVEKTAADTKTESQEPPNEKPGKDDSVTTNIIGYCLRQ